MKKFLIVTALLIPSIANAASTEQYTACEAAYRAKNKADKAAAPEGFKPDRPKGFKASFMIECLSK